MRDNENLKDLLLALLSAAGLLLGGIGALCIAALAQWIPVESIPGQHEAQTWSAIALAVTALCGFPGLLTAVRGFLDEIRPSIHTTSTQWIFSLLLLPLALFSNYLAYNREILPAILGPATNLLAAAFAVSLSIQLVLQFAPGISRRRFWGQFLTGLFAIPPAILVFELAALIPVIMILSASLLTGEFTPLTLDSIMDPNFNPQSYWQQLDTGTIFEPTSIALMLLYLGIAVPLIEELLKTAALWPFLKRITNPGEAYLSGALAGAGYGLFEALMLAQPGPTWMQVGLLRIGATFLHTATAALSSWGLFKAYKEKKWWIAPAAYGVSVLLHGLWNTNAIVFSWFTLEETSDRWIQTLEQNNLDILPAILFIILSAVTLISLPLMAKKTSNPDIETGQGENVLLTSSS